MPGADGHALGQLASAIRFHSSHESLKMEANLVLKAVWDNGTCSFVPSYSGISTIERQEINDLADEAGFDRSDEIWLLTDGRETILNFRKAMSDVGYRVAYVYDSDNGQFNLQRLHLGQGTRARLEACPDFELEDLSGWAPVQAEGRVDGRYFYFRARGSYWRLELGGNRTGTRSPRWWYEEAWETATGFGAGYLTDDEAIRCILKAVDIYRESDRSRFQPGHPDYERTVLEGWSVGALGLRHVARRLRISGEEAVTRAEKYGIEMPYYANLELEALKKRRTASRLDIDRSGVWVRLDENDAT